MQFRGRGATSGRNSGFYICNIVCVCVCVCVCACVQRSYFEGDLVSIAVCPIMTVQYHHSENFLPHLIQCVI
jgi:hypothetical protein